MSSMRRWVSGGLASGTRVAVGLGIQLASVPIFLSAWSPGQYAVWLIVAGLAPLLSAVDLGHQNYLAQVFMSERDEQALRTAFASSLVAGAVIGLLGVTAAVGLVWSGGVALIARGAGSAIIHQAEVLVVLQSLTWLVVGSLGGLLTRAMARIGAFPRAAWWGAVEAAITGLAPLLAVGLGGDLIAAGVALAVATLAVNIPMLGDFTRVWLAKSGRLARPDLRLATHQVLVSLGITARDLLIQMRQQGVRLVLAPSVGLAQMTVFATTRTGANLAVQGLNAVLWPLEPELLRFVRERDASRVDVALAAIWILLAVLVAPGLVAAQFVVPPLFEAWTRGRIAFDPMLFALLSATVAVFAFAQTATMVVRGANLVRAQLAASFVGAAVVLIGIAATAGVLGIRGATGALLAGEICIGLIYQDVAACWMKTAGLFWPAGPAAWAGAITIGVLITLIAVAAAPAYALMIVGIWMAYHFGACVAAYRAMPLSTRRTIAARLSPLGARTLRSLRSTRSARS